jgi:chorismate-pyruvate lyase
MSSNSILNSLINTTNSTSKLLEDISKRNLQVETIFQKEIIEEGERCLIRLALLYFDKPILPLILSISSLYCNVINEEELYQLKQKKIPIGKIFGVDNIYKTDLTNNRLKDFKLAKTLNVSDINLFEKKYILWMKDRKIGTIKEIFNKESIARI